MPAGYYMAIFGPISVLTNGRVDIRRYIGL